MKIIADTSSVTITDDDDDTSIALIAGTWSIRRCLTEGYIDLTNGVERVKVHTAKVTHFGGDAFAGDTQELMDAFVAALTPIVE